ncbi:VMO1 protein, partial [Chloropsis hardwickii]|nr:VMO1 protein [Chloropsis hardwickii]
LALLALLVALVAPLAWGWDRDAPTATLSVENGGHWGHWGDPEFCPGRSFASGFQLKVRTEGTMGTVGT